MRQNLRTSLRRRLRHGTPMAAFDRLPPVLRRWLAEAALPWSPRSVSRSWARALQHCGGDVGAALARLDTLERALIARDARAPGMTDDPSAQRQRAGRF